MTSTKLMFILSIIFLVLIEISNNARVLSRKKRYLVFPEGSTLSIAICMTFQTDVTPGEIYTGAMNWGISYDLPNDTKAFEKILGKPKNLIKRRHRRDLYGKMERIMQSMGYDGRNCILRALCEAGQTLKPKGQSLLDEILRIVFRYPNSRRVVDQEDDYQKATEKGIEFVNEDCFQMFPGCPFSLIDLALGYYSQFGKGN